MAARICATLWAPVPRLGTAGPCRCQAVTEWEGEGLETAFLGTGVSSSQMFRSGGRDVRELRVRLREEEDRV